MLKIHFCVQDGTISRIFRDMIHMSYNSTKLIFIFYFLTTYPWCYECYLKKNPYYILPQCIRLNTHSHNV